MSISLLEHSSNSSGNSHDWQRMCEQSGQRVVAFGGTAIDHGFARFLDEAAGLVLASDTVLHNAQARAGIRSAIRSGKNLLVLADSGPTALLNEFIDPYGMELTSIRVRRGEADADGNDGPALIRIERGKYPGAFRDPVLLDGVDSVAIQQPSLIRYGGDAMAVLTIPVEDEAFRVEDGATDTLRTWTSPAATCVAHGQLDGDAGAVMVVSGGVLGDPYRGALGDHFPGITANRRFAQNILCWLTKEQPIVYDRPTTGFILVDRIERRLVEYVQRRLERALPHWWEDGVPEPIRVKCASRCEEERNTLPKAAYLDLIDMKRIIDCHWTLFDRAFASVGWTGSKKVALDWVLQLNEIRRTVMHPTRRVFTRGDVTEAQLAFLRHTDARVARLARSRLDERASH